jgi:ketosteroid isomerase-like protein
VIARLTHYNDPDEARAAAERLAEERGQAVSQENVEIVVAGNRAFAARDLDAVLASCAPDVEVFPATAFPEAKPFCGRDAFRRWLEEAAAAWARMEIEQREAFALPDGRVVLRWEWRVVGATSGIETGISVTGIWTLRSGLVTRVEYYFDHNEALKAVGLAE